MQEQPVKALLRHRRSHGQYFTPPSLCDECVDLAPPEPGQSVCDPAGGSGNFLVSAARYTKNLHYVELDPSQVKHARQQFQQQGLTPSITCGDALQVPWGPVDRIYMNPPFGLKFNGKLSQIAFLELALSRLNPGGAAVAIVDRGTLTNQSLTEARAALCRSAFLERVVDLPQHIFSDYADTHFRTSVLVFRKDGGGGTTILADDSVASPGRVLTGDWMPSLDAGNGQLGQLVQLRRERWDGKNQCDWRFSRQHRVLQNSDRKVKGKSLMLLRGCLVVGRIVSGQSTDYLTAAPVQGKFVGAGATNEYYILEPRRASHTSPQEFLGYLWLALNFDDSVREFAVSRARGQGRLRLMEEDLLALPMPKIKRERWAEAGRLLDQLARLERATEIIHGSITRLALSRRTLSS